MSSHNIILQPFLRATECMSASRCPLLHKVIQVFDMPEDMLRKKFNNSYLHPIVCVAVGLGTGDDCSTRDC